MKILSILKLLVIIPVLIDCQPENKTLWTAMWSPDGKYIAIGGNDTGLKILNANDLSIVKSYDIDDLIVARVKWHPTKNLLAVITQSTTFKARILDLDTEEWQSLSNLPSSLRAIDWNHDGTLLAVSEMEKYVSVFDLSGELKSRFKTDEKGTTDLDWHPQKDILVTVGSQIGLYTAMGDTLSNFNPFGHEVFMLCAEWHNNGKFFAVGDYGDLEKAENKSLTYFGLAGKVIHRNSESLGEYRNIRWDPSGNQLATATDRLSIYSENGDLTYQSDSSSDFLWGIDWNPEGSKIVTSSSQGVVTIWSNKGKVLQKRSY